MQPVAKQAAGAESGSETFEIHVPCRLQQAPCMLEAREGVLDSLTLDGELLIEEQATLLFGRAACCFKCEIRCTIAGATAVVSVIGHIAEEVKIGMDQDLARAVQCRGLTATLRRVAVVDPSDEAWTDKQQRWRTGQRMVA